MGFWVLQQVAPAEAEDVEQGLHSGVVSGELKCLWATTCWLVHVSQSIHVGGECGAGGCTVAGEDVDDPGWETDVVDDVGETGWCKGS